jgi:hypothetical protein
MFAKRRGGELKGTVRLDNVQSVEPVSSLHTDKEWLIQIG